jgi:uncharacterized protein YbjT (DUF2867 family)
MTIAVIGATGRIGSAVVQGLLMVMAFSFAATCAVRTTPTSRAWTSWRRVRGERSGHGSAAARTRVPPGS